MAIRQRKNSGPSGLADVRSLKSGIRITFEDGSIYDLPKDALDLHASGKYLVSMSQDKTKAFLKAPKGAYLLRFVEMGNRTNGIPTNKVNAGGPRTGKDGSRWIAADELVFVSVFEIVSEGIYNGLKAQTYIPYSFAAPLSGDQCDFVDTKRNLQRLERFLGVTGDINMALDTGLKFSPDSAVLLLQLEKMLQRKAKVIQGEINDKGFLVLDTLSNVPLDFLPTKARKPASKKEKK